jgi:phosphoribosylaminoimidazole (AIR) synthetase
MYRVFNMGIGMAVILKRQDIKFAAEVLGKNHEQLLEIGNITSGKGIVEVV